MTAPNINEMRSIIMYSDERDPIMEKLKSVEGWIFEDLGIAGGHPYCLRQGNVKVAIRQDSNNVAMSSNVLPHDWGHDQDAANSVLISLSKALTDSGISNSITASQNDLGQP
jgi:hypothetical protein